MLREIFRNFFIRTDHSFEERYLVAVSGGKDSMVLLDLFHREGIGMEVAHANFQLRGEEALADENLVRNYCSSRGIVFHFKRFDTKAFALQAGISTQMAARDLRYTWFKTCLKERNLKAVAVAHHLQDNMETFFLNLSKGTGPKGLLGIPEFSEWLIRPLLHAAPSDILTYAKENAVPWREDASNQEVHYQRNRVRHQVLPVLKIINPGLEQTFEQNQDRIRQLYEIYKVAEKGFRQEIIFLGKDVFLPDSALQQPGAKLFLEEYLKPSHFTPAQIDTAYSGLEKGKMLLSATHRLVREKDGWLLQEQEAENEMMLSIPAPGRFETAAGLLLVEANFQGTPDFSDATHLYLAANEVHWPLQLRSKKEGDRFRPYGMKGSKLVSDYLKDRGLAFRQKQAQLILEDGKNILWIVGERSSDIGKIQSETAQILRIIFRKIN